MYKPTVAYEYRVGSHMYEGTVLFFGFDKYYTERGGRKRIDAYPAGRNVEVFYDPLDPSRSVLEPGGTMRTWVVVVAGAAILFLVELALLFH